MKTLLLFSLLFLTAHLSGQSATSYLDVVEVKKGGDRQGTLIGYRYGETVTLVEASGEVVEIPWSDIRRISFRTKRLEGSDRYVLTEDSLLTVLPARKWRHALTAWVGFAEEALDPGLVNSGFTDRTRFISTGIGYQVYRQFGAVSVGAGPGYEVMNAQRKERMVNLSGSVDYHFGKRRVQPFIRLRAGAGLPIGHRDAIINDRSVSPLIHPSLGIEITPPRGHWTSLFVDLGYRFTQLRTTVTNQNLEVIGRRVNYRRLTVSVGTNF